ncbi:MAG: outer membrane beta-barrel protein [Pseudolabrys sp.]
MKRLKPIAYAGLLAVMIVGPFMTEGQVFAADLPRPAYKAAPPLYAAPFSWSGFYIGLNGGYGWGKSSWSNVLGTTGDFNVKGFVGGGTLGYNLQTGVYVFGLEGDIDYSAIKGTADASCGAGSCDTRNTWLGTARGRVGYAWDRWLPFITGGAAFGGIRMTPLAGGTSESQTRVGWTLGGGVEYAFMNSWSAKLEYLYVDLGKTSCGATTCGLDTDVEFRTSIIRAGLNYRF